MRRIPFALLLAANLVTFSLAEDASFRRVWVADQGGRQRRAVLTFSDKSRSVEVRPAKGNPVTIPYSQIDKASYEFTMKHRINETSIATAPIGGAIVMLTKSKVHWLEIDYREQDTSKVFVLRMDKRNYLRILEALKAHIGIEAEVLGNADKRKR